MIEFKFHQRVAWARTMASMMRSVPWVEPALEAADLLIPMPLSTQRLRERGYNQAASLSRALDADKTRSDLLLRIRHTAPQSALPRQARLSSVKGAFAVDPLKLDSIKGRSVVLLDDVMTSGASLAAAALALRRAGAVHVTGLVFARTENA